MTNLPKDLTEHQIPSPSNSVEDKSFFPRKKVALLQTFLLLNIFRQKSGKVLISTRKNCKSFFFENQIFHKIFLSTWIAFWHTFWSFCAKVPESFPHSPKTVKKLINFCRKNSQFKNLNWTHRKQFWQTYRKSFAESPKNLCPNSKNLETIRRICFQKTNYSKISPGLLKEVSTTQQDYYRQKSEMFSSKSQKQLKFLKILWERKLFLQTCPLDKKKTVLTTMSKNFHKSPNNFPQIPFVRVNLLEENDNDIKEDHLNECRKQFFKLGWRLSDRSPQSFSSKLEKFVKVNIFFRKHTFLEKFFVQVKCTFDNFS